MEIKQIKEHKDTLMDLLLIADEQENMINKYLHRGEMFALYDDDLKSVAVVTNEGNNTFELKNIATYPHFQQQGYGRKLLQFIIEKYKEKAEAFLLGTGDSPRILRFYESCGFRKSHVVKNFFTDNYDHPIWEDGVQLKDMIYMKLDFKVRE